jgi:hypothetical protein
MERIDRLNEMVGRGEQDGGEERPAAEGENLHAISLPPRAPRTSEDRSGEVLLFLGLPGAAYLRLPASPASIKASNWASSAGLRSETAQCAMPWLRQRRTL